MNLDELASSASRKALAVGRSADRPPFSTVQQRHRRMVVATTFSIAMAAVVMVAASVAFWPASSPDPAPVAAEPTAPITRADCPVTSADDATFYPESETPDGPPSSYGAVWHGTPALYTMIRQDGEVWFGLPVAADGTLTQKTFWWIDALIEITQPDPDLTVNMQRWGDVSAAPVVSEDTTTGAREDIGVFAIVGLQIPEEGCWVVTAEHEGATLSYVVWVGDV